MIKRPELIPATLDGDLRRGGYILSGQVQGDTDAVRRGLNIRGTGLSLAGWSDFAGREWFNGHVLADPDFSFDRYSSNAGWQAGTADNLLAGESIQDISFADVASPANSHEATSWTFADVVEHILRHHCNYVYDASGSNGSPDGIIRTLDLDPDSTAFQVFIVSQSNNMWSTIQQIGGGEEGGGEFHRAWFDRRNRFHYQPAPPFISPRPTARGTLTTSHLRGTVQVRRVNSRPGQRVGQVTILAVDTPTSVLSATYPANPANGKILRRDSGIWADDQTRANLLATRLYKWLSRLYTLTVQVDAGLVLWGDDGRGLDLGDRVLVTYNGPAEDAVTGVGVHLNLSATSFYVYGINIQFDVARRTATATLTLEHDNL
ncbi:MAG: hypothetical protein BroJett011_04100 [Chloroflexota bacterium]|nr:MAG: hypothetical protein BroJett011_04100 [Chloroflexota bacterium]